MERCVCRPVNMVYLAKMNGGFQHISDARFLVRHAESGKIIMKYIGEDLYKSLDSQKYSSRVLLFMFYKFRLFEEFLVKI